MKVFVTFEPIQAPEDVESAILEIALRVYLEELAEQETENKKDARKRLEWLV